MRTTILRCEYAENPLGIDAACPRLSWQLEAGGGGDRPPYGAGGTSFRRRSGRGQRQRAFQVLAASSLEKLEEGQADRWDSGRVETGAVQVEYSGVPLKSGEAIWWKVRAWDQDNNPGPFSEPAWFEMGLLSPEDWQAQWIGYPGGWPGKALYFRRDFAIEKPVRRARMYSIGLGWSELRVNGQKVNDRVLDPPQSNYTKRLLYSTDAVEGLLRPGKNTIGVICGNGWYGTVRLLLQLDIEYQDGSRGQVVSGSNSPSPWLVSPGPLLENGVYDGEVYDARLEQPAWDAPDTPPTFHTLANFAEGPAGRRVAASLEPIRVVETLSPKMVSQPKPGVYVFDLGQNIAGWARIRVSGDRGTRVSLRFAETLNPDGTINQENLRNARAEDVYILKGSATSCGAGDETWEPRFTYHGFRYIQVTGWPGEPGANAVEGRVVRSSVAASGAFECSSDLYNRIWNLVRWTETGNIHSLPTDCPQRDERMGWLNDMAARTEGALYNFDMARLFAKWTADIEDEQDPRTGAITDTAPFRWGSRPADPVSVCYLLIPWLLYVHYGDRRTMADRYQGMQAWVDYLSTRAPGDIVEYSYYGDWSPPEEFGVVPGSPVSKFTPGELVSTACYAYSARLFARMSAVLEHEENARQYAALADRVSARFNERFWDEQAGGYGTNNQSCNAIAYYMGLVPEERRERVIASLVHDVLELHDGHLTTGNICTKYLLEALTAGGRADVACRIAAQETYPSWGFMLANGATTLWERWEQATGGGMNSHNHPMMGSVAAWLYRAIAGLQADPAGPGFERFDIRPNPESGLAYARASLQTVRGRIECAWQRQDGVFRLDLTVPAGSQARVFLPAQEGSILREGETVLWQAEAAETAIAETAEAASQEARSGAEVHREGPCLVCLVGSGDYHFAIG